MIFVPCLFVTDVSRSDYHYFRFSVSQNVQTSAMCCVAYWAILGTAIHSVYHSILYNTEQLCIATITRLDYQQGLIAA